MSRREELLWAEAYCLMHEAESLLPDGLIAPGTYERRMWMRLFRWAGWRV